MAGKFAVFALVALLAIGLVQAGDFEDPAVLHLTSSNYDDSVSDGRVHFIKYYAPWCGHCKRLASTWKDLAKSYAGSDKVAIGHVDCTVSRDICNTAEIKGYPTLKVVHKGEEYKAYRGPRDLDALKNFVDEAVSALLTESS
eukprot:CAMPEP_0202865488 /NCGR_PEP_ID=MMETSP1391-20130828/6169_1 /ASSEMBLY_ACC=CAM_ASM_000867 /TAXON_ID=1034604 /ORGANISM="Chlamydomonas leiostraca, Strain SAG 11-49" /LENGTH=141 /DNA_ID=CAMNT_0049545341 /DNA_START=25 /DNA_END=450 /DNA_ORIENTATION=+